MPNWTNQVLIAAGQPVSLISWFPNQDVTAMFLLGISIPGINSKVGFTTNPRQYYTTDTIATIRFDYAIEVSGEDTNIKMGLQQF